MNNLRPDHPDAILSLDKFTGKGLQVPFIEIRHVEAADGLSILTGDEAGRLNEFTLAPHQIKRLKEML